jgi:hypothetical protein
LHFIYLFIYFDLIQPISLQLLFKGEFITKLTLENYISSGFILWLEG